MVSDRHGKCPNGHLILKKCIYITGAVNLSHCLPYYHLNILSTAGMHCQEKCNKSQGGFFLTIVLSEISGLSGWFQLG